jgi:hypothetical protein
MLKRLIVGVAVLVALCAASGPARADLYIGNVSYGQGILATGGWKDTDTTLQWKIVQQGNDFSYTYTWHTDAKSLSHIILQVGSDAQSKDFWNFSKTPSDLTTYKPGDKGNSNPGLPGTIYGFKFDGSGTSYTVTFLSDLSPTWGNFYAKGGNVYAYDTGFGSNGSKIAIPGSSPVPLPPSLLFFVPGLAGLVLARKRLRK